MSWIWTTKFGQIYYSTIQSLGLCQAGYRITWLHLLWLNKWDENACYTGYTGYYYTSEKDKHTHTELKNQAESMILQVKKVGNSDLATCCREVFVLETLFRLKALSQTLWHFMSVMWEYLSLKFNLEQETRGSKQRAFLWLLVHWFKTLFRGPKAHLVQRLDGMVCHGMSWNSAPSCGFVTKSSHGPVASGPTPQQRGNTKSSLADPPLLCLCLALVLTADKFQKVIEIGHAKKTGGYHMIPTSKTNQRIFDDLVGSIEISPTPPIIPGTPLSSLVSYWSYCRRVPKIKWFRDPV